jgi:nitroimidazol reductase NimA-like FMN-containing flavoprotein (pyridoxamine 5'-phosphate oxidase superfamily)
LAYTQSPHLTNEEIESLLKQAKVARFCSLNRDGTIHAVPVWYAYENGQIIVATPSTSRKARNARRNENVTVLVDDSETRGAWPKGAIVYGKARFDATDLQIDEFTHLCEKYFPREKAKSYVKGLLSLSSWVKISVKPERVASFDYSKDEEYKTAVGE